MIKDEIIVVNYCCPFQPLLGNGLHSPTSHHHTPVHQVLLTTMMVVGGNGDDGDDDGDDDNDEHGGKILSSMKVLCRVIAGTFTASAGITQVTRSVRF